MYDLVMIIHVIVSLLLVIVVLLQSGKSADLAGAFGGMGSQSTFGPRGTATLLSKLTTTLAILFMVTSLSLWIIQANRSGPKSAVEEITPAQTPATQTTAPTSTTPGKETAVPTEDATTQPPATTPPATTTPEKDAAGETKAPGTGEKDQQQPPAAATDSKQ